MNAARRILLVASLPLVGLVVVGTLRARVQSLTDDTLRELKVFSEAIGLVGAKYVDAVDAGQLERGAFQGVAESLDPWSSYHDPLRMAPLLARDTSGDIGVVLFKVAQQYVRIGLVMPDSPADVSGIRRLDHVETIDGLATKDLTLLEARAMLAGPPGSVVKLGFFRTTETGEGRVVEVTRAVPAGWQVASQVLEPSIGLVRVTDLGAGVSERVREKLTALAAAGARDVVLDLRHAAGGSAEEAAAVAGLFVDAGKAFALRTRSGTRDVDIPKGRAWTGRTVALIGRATIGEAELVAVALRERGAVPLVGQPTFGKRGWQDLVRLPDGSGLLLTVGNYLGPDGEPLPKGGVLPDAELAAGTTGKDSGAVDEPAGAGAVAEDDEEAEAEDGTGEPGVTPAPAAAATRVLGPVSADKDIQRALELLRTAAVVRKAA